MAVKILIADKLAEDGPRWLQSQEQVEVTVSPGLSEPDLISALRSHDGVVVRSAVQLRQPLLDQAAAINGTDSRLRAIARAGVGVDNIDLDAATRHGIAVMNSASASTITTAEHAFALMIALARNVGPAYLAMTSGGWERSKFVGRQLHGRTLGVVGMGRIGRTLAERALAFGMNVIGYDPYINADSLLEGRVPLRQSFDELIRAVDVVSFHVPKTDDTVGMLGREQFAMAKPGLLVVNAARGGIVNDAALLEALEDGQCGGAAIDVYDEEPPPADSPLRNHPKILTTPHLGASTAEAQEAVAVDACRALLQYLRGEGLDGVLNVGGLQLDLSERQRQFVDLARRMIDLLHAAADDTHLAGARFIFRGQQLAGRAETIARHGLAHLLQRHLDQPVNIVNARLLADERRIDVDTIIASERGDDRLRIELHAPGGVHTVEGAIYEDARPRVTALDGYHMDMVPAGHLILLTNADTPGRIGLVGSLFGESNVNIAEMVIARKPREEATPGDVAMMIIKTDEPAGDDLIQSLRATEGIQRVARVEL